MISIDQPSWRLML